MTLTNYGERQPSDVEFHTDATIINTNIHNTPKLDEMSGETVDDWWADATRMTNEAYKAVKKAADEQAKAENDEVFLEMDADICALYDLIEGGGA